MNEDHGKLLLRLMLGVLTLFHGIDKVIGGIDGIVNRFDSAGLPGAIAALGAGRYSVAGARGLWN